MSKQFNFYVEKDNKIDFTQYMNLSGDMDYLKTRATMEDYNIISAENLTKTNPNNNSNKCKYCKKETLISFHNEQQHLCLPCANAIINIFSQK